MTLAAFTGRRSSSGNAATADALAAWLGGQPHVAASAKRSAGIRGELDHFGAMGFLQGLLEVLRDAGHPGLLLVLDEVETLQRVRSDVRDKALNAMRQLLDEIDSGRYPGLYLMITGTPAGTGRRGRAGAGGPAREPAGWQRHRDAAPGQGPGPAGRRAEARPVPARPGRRAGRRRARHPVVLGLGLLLGSCPGRWDRTGRTPAPWSGSRRPLTSSADFGDGVVKGLLTPTPGSRFNASNTVRSVLDAA